MPETPQTAGSPGQSQQAPFGSSPATGPSPNKGYEAAGLQRLGIVLKQMTEALPLLGANSEPGQVLMKCIQQISKFVPAGSVTPAGEKNNIEAMAMRNTQNNAQMQAMKPQGAPGGQPPAAGGQPSMAA